MTRIRFGMLILSLLLSINRVLAKEEPSGQIVLVETVKLKQQTFAETVSGYGVVTPDTKDLETVSLARSGQIVSLRVNAGQQVKKGDLLLEFNTSADATLNHQQAKQNVAFAKEEMVRLAQMVGQQLATQSQLAAAKKSLADAEASLSAQNKIGAHLIVEQVVAPFDGVVMALRAAQGDRLAADIPVLQLLRSGSQRVLIGVEPEQARRIRLGMVASANPVFNTELQLSAQVDQVFGMINPQTQLVDVLLAVAGETLLPGTRVQAKIELAKLTGWVLPRAAVLHDDNGAYFFQVVDGKAHRINTLVGMEKDDFISVNGTFDPSLPVVSLGNYELQDGMSVRGDKQ